MLCGQWPENADCAFGYIRYAVKRRWSTADREGRRLWDLASKRSENSAPQLVIVLDVKDDKWQFAFIHSALLWQ